ncbi:MAG: DUF4249 family protein [Saprospiraceae bacterium]|nr:DUF4249 family protein [Saprospiraceae bacterium]
MTKFLLCLMGLLMLRCAREVVIDLPEEEPKVVAICHFTDGQHFRAHISLSQPVNDGTDPEFPEELDAAISIDGQIYDLLYREKGDGNDYYWKSHLAKLAQTGVEYTFFVRVPGYPVAEGSSKIPIHRRLEPIHINASEMVVENMPDGNKELRLPLELRLSELPAEERFFAFFLNHDTDVYESFNPPEYWYTKEQQPTNFLADGRTISLLHNIPEPVVLINQNYWADDRRTLYLTARIPFDPESERPTKLYITWRTLSEAFYRYHLSLSRQGGNQPLSDPDAVFNNMVGGLGNFSGYSVSVDTIQIPSF